MCRMKLYVECHQQKYLQQKQNLLNNKQKRNCSNERFLKFAFAVGRGIILHQKRATYSTANSQWKFKSIQVIKQKKSNICVRKLMAIESHLRIFVTVRIHRRHQVNIGAVNQFGYSFIFIVISE